MDNENQSEKKLSAPEVDHMKYQAEHMPDISDDRTKLQVLMLFQKMHLMTGITTKPITVGIHWRSAAEGILLTFPCMSVLTRKAGGLDWPVPA